MTSCPHNDMRDRNTRDGCVRTRVHYVVRVVTERKLHKFAYRPIKIVATFKCVSSINLEINVLSI